jgi:hypothetical protein
MQALSIATNETTVFIHLDKSAITAATVAEVNAYLQHFLAQKSEYDIEYVSDEEQRDIEATLVALTDEDKQLGKRFHRVVL